PVEERPEIDRWILSELHTLIRLVDDAYADYEPTRATRAISDFVQENLSNWYVRLNRRRFWKPARQNDSGGPAQQSYSGGPARQGHSGGDDYQQDKISAYQTLYTCLTTVAKLSAPVAPFFMDRLYKDLTKITKKESFESVHLANFPDFDPTMVNKDLESRMSMAQTVASLVLSIRQKERIKVRQPLQKIMITVLDRKQKEEIQAVEHLIKSEVNVKELELLDDASGILVKRIRPNFKVLGPRFGKDMKLIAQAVGAL